MKSTLKFVRSAKPRLLLLLVPSLLMLLAMAVTGAPSSTEHIVGEQLITLEREPSASIIEIGPHYQNSRTFISKVYEAEQTFQLLGLNWDAVLPKETAAALEIRFRTLEDEWTDWEPLQADEDHPTGDDALWTYILTPDSEAFQYRVFLSTSNTSVAPKLSKVSFDAVNGGEESLFSQFKTGLEKLVFKNDNKIIDRDDWGADESLRLAKTYNVDFASSEYASELSDEEVAEDPDMEIVDTVFIDEDGDKLYWPLEYPAEVKKIIIHHTATSSDLDDPETAIRAIYQYHSVTRGWGDIGYNYLVAPDGSIYEGRAGGDGVVAGHASGYNTGSVGIALLGNYEESEISGEMMQGLTSLIYEKADLHDIDPNGAGNFRGESIPNILGHRDVGSTACPGDHTYDYMDAIRNLVGNALDTRRNTNTDDDYAYEEVGNRELLVLDPGEAAGISLKIKNTGEKTWTKDTYLVVNADSESEDFAIIPKDSKKRTAQMKETSVKPGSTASFTFIVTAARNGGLAQFDMSPVFNGTEKTQHYMDLGLFVNKPTLDFDVQSEDVPEALKPGQSEEVTIKIKNEGTLTWEKEGDYAVTLVQSGSSDLVEDTTLASPEEDSVAPGESATFKFIITAPETGGNYTLYYYPQMTNSNAEAASSGQISVQVSDAEEDLVISDAFSDLTFEPGEKKTVWIKVKNTSVTTWSQTGSKAFGLAFTKPSGLTTGTPKISFKNLPVGASFKIYFSITAPDEEGSYTLEIRPRLGQANLSTAAYKMKITVEAEELSFDKPDYENPIRIKLTPEGGVGTPVVTSKSTFALYDDDELIKTFSANSRVRSTYSGGSFVITFGSAKWTLDGPARFTPVEDGIMKILTMNQKASWDETINDNQFRGTVEHAEDSAEPSGKKEGILINELPLENYLMGMAEETNDTPTEKLKTMAILARSYAYYYLTQAEKFPGMPYDGEDDPNTFQKYLGYGYELRHPNVAAAAQNTEGTVVSYKGTIIKTPYFSKSDGVATKNAKDVWGWTNAPYLVSVPDLYCNSTAFSGHGVGLSGCGAKTLAEQGWTFEEIIKYYYTGVELTSLE